MAIAELDLDLDIFAGPFDLLMAVVLREEVSLLDLQLGEVVVAYIEHLEREGELELEVATEFLVLIAALLELKSRLMLPGPEDELDDLSPEEAIEELLARMLEYRRYRDASAVLADRFESQRGYLYRSAPLPPELRRVAVEAATAVYDPERARRRPRRPADRAARRRHQPHPPDRLPGAPPARPARRPPPPHQLRLRRGVRRRGPADPGGDDLRPAGALPQGRDHLGAGRAVRPDPGPQGGRSVSDLTRTLEALLFLSAQPVAAADLAQATEATEGQVAEAIELLREDLAEGKRGIVLREVSGGFALASDPASEEAARRLLSKPRTPPLTQAQAETLAIVAYLQPVSRPEVARIRGVSSESAVQGLAERGLIEEAGRSQFGAAIFKTSELFERLFGLSGLDQLPDPVALRPQPRGRPRAARAPAQRPGEQRGRGVSQLGVSRSSTA